ncbi:MAG TPA: CPBP family intramembrane glutamic endopeptidase [Chlorobaculum sp.]|nr:CPBP family intramembrane glutamic endopeptidase [Chlorobaculum sp.]
MNSFDDGQEAKRPRLLGTALVLLSILVAYPLVGSILMIAVARGRTIDPDFRWIDGVVLPWLLAAQAFGQIIVLGLPVFWLARRFSGDHALGRTNLSWLGIGNPSGLRSVLTAVAGMLLLQPFLYSLVELQSIALPLMGEFGRDMLRDQARLDLFISKIAGGGSISGFLATAAVIVLTPAICEELFFRGFVQKSLSEILSPTKGVLLTGLVFALFHMEWFNLLPLTLLGWYIGYIYLKSGDLAVPAAAHGTNNLMALVLLKIQGLTGVAAADNAASGLLTIWQWWVFVLFSLVAFFLLIRRFPEKPAPNTIPDRQF